MKKKAIIAILMASLCLTLGCSSNTTTESGKPAANPESHIVADVLSPEEKRQAESEELEKFPEVKKDEVLGIGDTVEVFENGGIKAAYTVEKVETTKTLGDHQPPDMWPQNQLNESGTETAENYSFVWVYLTVENKGDKDLDFVIGNLMPRRSVYDGENGDPELQGFQELRIIEGRNIQIESKGHCFIGVGEEAQLTIGYIMHDKILNDIYYQLGGEYGYEGENGLEFREGDKYLVKLFE